MHEQLKKAEKKTLTTTCGETFIFLAARGLR